MNLRSVAKKFQRLDAKRLKQLALVLVLAFLVTSFLVASTARAESFSIDMTGMMDVAAQIFNGLWKAFAVVLGLSLGIGILNWIFKAIQSAF